MYEDLIERLREAAEYVPCIIDRKDAIEAADVIEELRNKVDRAIGFWDSLEIAKAIRELNDAMPNITDPNWQKVHMDMGFYSPIGEVYKDLGFYDEPPKEG